MIREFFASVLLLSSTVFTAMADKNDAYIYIQGDGETPFYVKMEGEMQPRLAQNYSVLSHLASGTVHLQVLFQQNKYPLQNYTITVPESGTRNFILKKVDADNFALVDIDKPSHYLMNNNKDEAESAPIAKTPDPVETVPAKSIPEQATASKLPQTSTTQANTVEPDPEPVTATENVTTPPAPKDRFIDGVVLGGGGKQTNGNANNSNTNINTNSTITEPTTSSTPTETVSKPKSTASNTVDLPLFNDGNTEGMAAEQQEHVTENTTTPVKNVPTSCDVPVSGEEFGTLYANAGKFNSDEDKLQYMRNSLVNYCFTSGQVMQLCDQMGAQSAKYECARFMYPHTTDPENYSVLDDLFSSKYLKNKLHNEVMATH